MECTRCRHSLRRPPPLPHPDAHARAGGVRRTRRAEHLSRRARGAPDRARDDAAGRARRGAAATRHSARRRARAAPRLRAGSRAHRSHAAMARGSGAGRAVRRAHPRP
ncbi:MAG: hypothetical protein M3Y30_01440 [Gemmatimonadota bacterium]|nr:hypothetical protein [Gemmatimonadota bacterium]